MTVTKGFSPWAATSIAPTKMSQLHKVQIYLKLKSLLTACNKQTLNRGRTNEKQAIAKMKFQPNKHQTVQYYVSHKTRAFNQGNNQSLIQILMKNITFSYKISTILEVQK